MSLKIRSFSLSVSRVIGVILLTAIAICLIKVFIWEQIYYSEKEGTIRNPVINAIDNSTSVEESAELDETPITESQITEYTVASDKPRYLTIPSIGVNKARILEIGLINDNKLDAPVSIYDVGWYRDSSKPGEGGTLLMDGHNGGPTTAGVFKNLDSLAVGDQIMLERGDGVIFTYEVVENNIMNLEDAENYMSSMVSSPISGQESLSLITCAGDWTNTQHTYLSRAMVRAVLVSQTNN